MLLRAFVITSLLVVGLAAGWHLSPVAEAQIHIVQEGDTLLSIAQRYGTTVTELRAMNNLRGDAIRAGQRLRVRAWAGSEVWGPVDDDVDDYGTRPAPPGVRPPDLRSPEPIPTGPPPPPPPPATINRIEIGGDAIQPLATEPVRTGGEQTGSYRVRQGDTLFSIARRFGTTVVAIQRANSMRDDRISIGQDLAIPGGAGAVAPPAALPRPGRYDVRRSTIPGDEVHTVLPGETLFSIAARYGTTAGRLLAFNSVNTGPLVPGTILVLPDGVGRLYHREPAPPRADVEGLALVYPASYIGRTTISGEDYDPDQLTASHRTLPFGTIVRVISVATGRETLVRINDRGPVSEGFVTELSDASARALGLQPGSAHEIKLQVLR